MRYLALVTSISLACATALFGATDSSCKDRVKGWEYTLFPGHTSGGWENAIGFVSLNKDATISQLYDAGTTYSNIKDKLLNIKRVYSNIDSFVALKSDGTIVVWGIDGYSDSSNEVVSSIKNVVNIFSTISAYTALKSDGTVVSWGDESMGGDNSKVSDKLRDITDIASTYSAFAALRKDGSVVTWGDSKRGGDSSGVQSQLKDVVKIYSNYSSFAALKKDGSVVTWGDSRRGGDSSSVKDKLNGVVAIYSNSSAFAALKKDGSVVTWGDSKRGGDSSKVQSQLKDISYIYSTLSAFAALKKDGSVVTWGYNSQGGDSSNLSQQLNSIKEIYSNEKAFVALKKDGSIVAWGDKDSGGDISDVVSKLKNIKTIYSAKNAFSALREDGKVVSWGDIDSTPLESELHDIVDIASIDTAFLAYRKDGNIIMWWNNDEYIFADKNYKIFKSEKEISALYPHFTIPNRCKSDSINNIVDPNTPTIENITLLYIATFNRAPDKAGIDYWVNNSGLNVNEIAASFFDQKETQELYKGYNNHEFIKAVYKNLFNREPDSAGWQYWESELNNHRIAKSHFILAVINGALGDDAKILENKQKVGLAFVHKDLNDINKAKEIMKSITADPSTVNRALDEINKL